MNGREEKLNISNGFCSLERVWSHDEIHISFSIEPVLVYANPLVRSNVGKVAIMRGPEIYCFEEEDNGKNLAAVYQKNDTVLTEKWEENLLGGTMVVCCEGIKLAPLETDKSTDIQIPYKKQPITLKAIPYGSWCNRNPGEMIVLVHYEV